MKLTIEQADDGREPEILIRCGPCVDERLQRLIDQIRLYAASIAAKREGVLYQLSPQDIYYIESVDEKTFLYTEREVYECSLRLYELEEQLRGTSFIRVSKAVILNTAYLDGVRPLLNCRLEARMKNGERILVNRHYGAAFKEKFGL